MWVIKIDGGGVGGTLVAGGGAEGVDRVDGNPGEGGGEATSGKRWW